MRPISTFTITIKTFYVIVKGGVDDLLRPTPKPSTITATITFYIVINNIIDKNTIKIYTEQLTMVTWFMGGSFDGDGNI